MARVFISYRRADGQYAVGWIEERLRQIEGGTDVSTAFRDSDLRHGDDFPARLALEVDACDVLIAVIGPHWHGDDGRGRPRILDPADWVGREITSALADPDKLIIPVLLSGVEPLRADDLLPEHRRFADLHALRFDGRDDVETLATEVGEHLARLDEERTRASGLDQPIAPPSGRPGAAVVSGAVAAAVVAGVAGWLAVDVFVDASNTGWATMSAVQSAYWAGACVLGVWYLRTRLRSAIEVNPRVALRSGALALVLIGLTVTSFAPGDTDQVIVTLLQAVGAIVLLSPWIAAVIGPGWSTTSATALRDRALTIATQRRGLGHATGVLSVALALTVCTSGYAVPADGSAALSMVGFGIFLTLIVIGGVEYSHARMRNASGLLSIEVREYGDVARRHVGEVVVADRRDLWPWILCWALVPTVVSVVVGAVIYWGA